MLKLVDMIRLFPFKSIIQPVDGLKLIFKILNKYRLAHIVFRTICITGLFQQKKLVSRP